jgi:hypothetical protein
VVFTAYTDSGRLLPFTADGAEGNFIHRVLRTLVKEFCPVEFTVSKNDLVRGLYGHMGAGGKPVASV